MKTTKKPMMAKRTTKAAPAKKKMMTSAKKPMTVAGKKVRKYQVGGPAMATSPTAMNPGRKPVSPVQQPKVPPKQPGMSQGFPKGRPGMPGMPGQGMIANNGGPMMGQSPNYAQANELLSRMDPRSPFYGAIQQRLQQTGGLQANNGGNMIANNPGGMGMLSPEQIARNNMARQQLMQQGMTPGQIQAQEAAIRQEMLRRGMPLGQGMGLPVQRPGSPGMGIDRPPQQALSPAQLAQIRAQEDAMRQRAQQLMQSGELVQHPLLGSPGMGMANPSPGAVQGGTMAQDALGRRFMERMQQPSRFRDGGKVKGKNAPANGRMAKPKGRTAPRGRK